MNSSHQDETRPLDITTPLSEITVCAYRSGAVYDPNSGIIAGAGAGFTGNRYTGFDTAGDGGFAYNTNTGAGVAAGKNNVYPGKDGGCLSL
jgi:hypothetical protein